MYMIAAGLLAGLLALAWLQQQAALPSPWLACGLVLGGLPLLRGAAASGRYLGLGLLCAGLMLGQAGWRAQQRLDQGLAAAWEGQDLAVLARVDRLPQATAGLGGSMGWRLALTLDALADGRPLPAGVPRRVSALGFPRAEGPAWRACERWQLTLRLRQPRGLVNPQGFDQELWLFEQGLRASASIRPAAQQRLDEAAWHCIDHWRERLRERLQQALGPGSASGLLVALSLGDQGALSPADWQLYRDTGIAHLVAISGLHVTLFAWGAARLGSVLWRRSAWLCLRLPAPLAAAWLGLAAAALYAAFAGWGVPAQRTVWMLGALALLRQLGRSWPWPLSLLAAADIVCVLDPWALCQPGFWLSFVAVGLLMAQGEPVPGERSVRDRLTAALKTQLMISAALAPLSLILFQQLSVVGVLANLLAIPWVSFVITPLALAGALAPPLWSLGAWAAEAMHMVLRPLAELGWATLSLPVSPPWAQALALLGAAWLAMPWPWRLRAAGLPMVLTMLWPAQALLPEGRFSVLAADVGQGTAVLLRTRQHSLLYDAGPRWSAGSDAGERVILPLLRAQGLRPLDLMLLSHQDLDHIGGAGSVLRRWPVRRVLSSMTANEQRLRGLPPAQSALCQAGQSWGWDGVRFELLHPQADASASGKSNERSCVLRVSDAQGRSALLTGDIEAAQERSLLQSQGQVLRSELLMLSHHGSAHSSTPLFLATVAPRMAVAQAGYRNRYGHPAAEVQERLRMLGVPLWQSAWCGAWHWRSDEAWPRCERVLQARYWRAPAAEPARGGSDEIDGAPE